MFHMIVFKLLRNAILGLLFLWFLKGYLNSLKNLYDTFFENLLSCLYGLKKRQADVNAPLLSKRNINGHPLQKYHQHFDYG